MRNTAAVRVETEAPTPASEILTSTPLTVASPSTHASASGEPSAKRRCVRGPTCGKRIRKIIAENKGERISAYVTPEMRAFCGINANKVASELGTQIRWICPIQGFYASWNDVSDDLKRAVLQAVRDKFKVTENGVEGTELVEQIFQEKANLIYKDWKWRMNNFYTKTLEAGLDAYHHPFQEIPIDDWKYLINHARKIAGKLNREAVPYGHTMGSRSFAAVITIAVRHFAHSAVLTFVRSAAIDDIWLCLFCYDFCRCYLLDC
ncbi:uncharacterized protein LOC131323793 [Rhododendron vialii]|uniref:uncharacterized protein LOC131323793 n=1 Tax=Rhododendron vialii TaxID=182163 RepID=UPI00265DEFE8|nr:uncharacterized protein LOC131323793 [Rhododendron vialii]